MKKLIILILLSISFCLLCNADTYTYTGQTHHKNVEKLLIAIKAAIPGVVFSYVDYYGEDIDNCSYKVNTDIALDSGEQTTLAGLLSDYNVSNWAGL